MSQVRPIEDLFAELVERKTAAERDAYLDEAEEACIHYLAGNIETPNDLISMADGSRLALANIHLTVAMKFLTEGKHTQSIKHLQCAVDTQAFSADYDWARSYLNLIQPESGSPSGQDLPPAE